MLDVFKIGGLILIFALSASSNENYESIQIEVEPGSSITGFRRGFYDEYLRIPYAEPPIGALRFRNPRPIHLWKGNLVAQNRFYSCRQLGSDFGSSYNESEDCLYLNIFTPIRNSTHKLPVVFFIHGGGFHSGTNNPDLYGPEYLMETEKVVLVTVAYRLNIFGFLATGDKSTPGNFGLKDQVEALQWVQNHIEAFGGDPGRVTLMGHEAGAVSVNYHLISPSSLLLFKRAFLLSGFIDSPWALRKTNPREFLNAHARALSFDDPPRMASDDLVELFRSTSSDKLVDTLKKLLPILPSSAYLPTIEPEDSVDPFLTIDPDLALIRGQTNEAPVMMSVVPADGMIFLAPFLKDGDEFLERLDRVLPQVLGINWKNPNTTMVVQLIRMKYLNDSQEVTNGNLEKVLNLVTDWHFNRPLFTTVRKLAEGHKYPVYVHLFDYRGSKSFTDFFPRKDKKKFGVVHMDDLLALFPFKKLFGDHKDEWEEEKDAEFRRFFLRHLVQFFETGDPGYKESTYMAQSKMARFVKNHFEEGFRYEDMPSHYFWQEIRNWLRLHNVGINDMTGN